MIATKLLPLLSESDVAEYVRYQAWRDFRSERCICGRHKGPCLPFCRACWKRLPVEMRKTIWAPGVGKYVESYRRAVEWLRSDRCP